MRGESPREPKEEKEFFKVMEKFSVGGRGDLALL